MSNAPEAAALGPLNSSNAGEVLRLALNDWYPIVHNPDGWPGQRGEYQFFYRHLPLWLMHNIKKIDSPRAILDIRKAINKAAGENLDATECELLKQLPAPHVAEAVGEIVLLAAGCLDNAPPENTE